MAWQFIDEELNAAVASGDTASITGDEARHAVVVSRLRAGERIRIADGRGLAVSGPITLAERDRVSILVERLHHEPLPVPSLHLAQALAKGGRDEQAVQAATELGVEGIIPWQAQRSITRWTGDKAGKGPQRWRLLAREAAKQSLRARIPQVAEAHDTARLTRLAAPGTVLVVLDPAASTPLTEAAAAGGLLATASEVVLIVGPEGGIAPAELDELTAAGALSARLGDSVLRTATAGPAALAVLQASLGSWAPTHRI